MRLHNCTLLVHSLNIFSAYKLYADPRSDEVTSIVGSQYVTTKAEHFKRTFSHMNVRVHFVGAWCVI